MIDPGVLLPALRRLSPAVRELGQRLPGWFGKLVVAWLRWFWRLTILGKLLATGAEIVALQLLVASLPLAGSTRSEIVYIGTLALVVLLLAGVLGNAIRGR